MKKLVLAIIGVICVQFVFVHYMTLQTPFEVSLASVNTESEIVQTVSLGDDQPSGSLEPAPESPAVAKSVKPNPVLAETNYTVARDRRTKRAVRPTEDSRQIFITAAPRMAKSGDFETVVISYNREPDPSNCEPRVNPQPKNRTYTAKAILKKPWAWMKAFGSKFN